MSKRVFVTGSHGFLGSHVVRQLKAVGHEVIAVPHSRLNLLDVDATRAMLRQYRPLDAVIHLAAVVGGIQANQRAPAEFLENNLLMGVNMLSVSYDLGVMKYVGVGTVCSYPENPPHIPFIEDDLFGDFPEPTNAPYGYAKRTLMLLGQAYRQQYNYNAITVVPTNLYGPGDDFDPATSHVIPALIKKVLQAREDSSQTIDLWGDGTATRDFLYVEDAARGIQMALDGYDSGEPVNLGSGIETSIDHLCHLICNVCGWHGYAEYNPSKPNGQPRRVLDITRARDVLGWRPAVDLEDGLRRTVAWYLKERSGV